MHELKNPLGVIALNQQLLARQVASQYPDDVKLQQRLERIAISTTQLQEIIDAFLDFARPGRPDPDRIDINAVMQEAIDQFHERMQDDEIAYTFHPSKDLNAVPADPRHIRSIFSNIIGNACDALHAKDGERRIVILARNRTGRVSIVIANNGPALAPGAAANLFDPFHSSKSHGTGLGLAIVKRLVELHRGRVWVNSDPDQGVSFTIELPTNLGPAQGLESLPMPEVEWWHVMESH